MRAPGRLRSPGPAELGRAGVSAHLLMAGIWGVIERGGRPGARVGLHEQLNVIRPRPSGSSWVIDNPAAFLPGPRHQTGGRRRAGQRGRARGPGPSPPRRPRFQGENGRRALLLPRGLALARWPGAAGEGRARKRRGGRESPEPGRRARPERPGRHAQAGLRESVKTSLEPGEQEWQQRSRRGETGDSGNENTSKTEKY